MNSSDRPLIGIPCRSDSSVTYQGRPINAQNSSYIRAVINAGGVPFLIPLEARDEVLQDLFAQAGGILLTGGGDIAPQFLGEASHLALNDVQSARDELEFTLVRWALEESKPMFGICRGIQVMNVIEGIEVPNHPFAIGVQWHPEELVTSQETAQRLFLAFVNVCRN